MNVLVAFVVEGGVGGGAEGNEKADGGEGAEAGGVRTVERRVKSLVAAALM